MNSKEFDEIRYLIEQRFLRWYKEKPKQRFESLDFEKNLYTSNLEVYEEMVTSFNEIIGRAKTIEACTLRKLFYYKKTNFSKSTLEIFNEYIKNKNFIDSDNLANLSIEFEKWEKSTISPIIEHHYLMTIERFRENIAFVITNIANIKEEYLTLFMINSIYYGDYAMHYLIAPCHKDIKLIQFLIRYAFSSWIRVSWRAAYILSRLDAELVNKHLSEINFLNEIEKEIVECIKNRQIEKFLENIISGESDINTKFYATQVLKQIRYKITTANSKI